jgi:nitrogenase molybdenum-iron protein alpha/beta subunit
MFGRASTDYRAIYDAVRLQVTDLITGTNEPANVTAAINQLMQASAQQNADILAQLKILVSEMSANTDATVSGNDTLSTIADGQTPVYKTTATQTSLL